MIFWQKPAPLRLPASRKRIRPAAAPAAQPEVPGRVHVATTTRKYKGMVYRTHLLRRTDRAGKQVKGEPPGNISHLPDSVIDLIRRSLAGWR